MEFQPKGFTHLKIGDKVTRLLGGEMPMEMVVSNVKGELIYCCPAELGVNAGFYYTFDGNTGAEIDDEMGWGNNGTGSFLRRNTT
jgi:hypothetical protein